MYKQAQEFVIKPDFEFLCLLKRPWHGDDDVSEYQRPLMQVFVHQGEGEHVSVFFNPAVKGIDELHPPAVDKENAQFG